jgi:hypothetical protein
MFTYKINRGDWFTNKFNDFAYMILDTEPVERAASRLRKYVRAMMLTSTSSCKTVLMYPLGDWHILVTDPSEISMLNLRLLSSTKPS